jgi:hypothetical protein
MLPVSLLRWRWGYGEMVLGGLGDGHGKEKNPVQAVNTFVCRSSQVHFRVLKQMSF